jgi:hypothetical protein
LPAYELVKGEPVTIAKLVHPGTAGFMAVMLTPGMRAVRSRSKLRRRLAASSSRTTAST